MPLVYNRKISHDATDSGGRPGKPRGGGLEVHKAQGNQKSWKISQKGVTALTKHYSCSTVKDLLEALKLEEAKGAGNRLPALEEEDAYVYELNAGSDPFDKSKEGWAGYKDHRTAKLDAKSFTGAARTTAQSTAATTKK